MILRVICDKIIKKGDSNEKTTYIFKHYTDKKKKKKVNNSVSNKISNNNYVYNTNLTNSAKDYVESNEVKDYDSNYSDNSPTFFISS